MSTWNSADKTANITLSNGDLTASMVSSFSGGVRGDTAVSTGKLYFECAVTLTNGSMRIGLATSAATLAVPCDTSGDVWTLTDLGVAADCDTQSNAYTGYTDTNVVAVAVDIPSGKVWFAVNNTYINSGDPAAGTGHALTIPPGSTVYPYFYAEFDEGGGTREVTAAFTSGDFTYSPPSGFSAIYAPAPPTENISEEADAADEITSTTTITRYITDAATDNEAYGTAVAMSSDGLVMAVGARGYSSNAGRVYIYDRSGETWTLRGTIASPGAGIYFGSGVGLSDDGAVIAVGAFGYSSSKGGVYIYDWGGASWGLRGTVLTASDGVNGDQFGCDVALSDDGLVLAVGAMGRSSSAGAVYFYDWGGASWSERAGILTQGGSTLFGYGVALGDGGDVLAVGRVGDSKVYTYDWGGASWSQRGTEITVANAYGAAVALTPDAQVLFVGRRDYNGGAVYMYDVSGVTWVKRHGPMEQADTVSGDQYGDGIACAMDGEAIRWAAGAPSKDLTGTNRGVVFLMYEQPESNLSEGVACVTTLASTSFTTLNDGVFCVASETHHIGLGGLLSATGEAVDTLVSDTAAWLYEAIVLGDALDARADTSLAYADTVLSTDTIQAVLEELWAESAAASEDWYVALGAALADMALATTTPASSTQAMAAISEAIVAVELAAAGQLQEVMDTAGAEDAMTHLLRATQAVLEQATAADAMTSYVLVYGDLYDAIDGAESVALWQSLTVDVAESAGAFVRLSLSGEVYTGWVMHTGTGAVTEYQGLSFNSMARIGGTYFGAMEGGLYAMEGADDAGTPIAAYIRSGLVEFADGQAVDAIKRISHLYLGCDASGNIAVKVTSIERGVPVEHWYAVTAAGSATDTARVNVGKGKKARYWQFEIASEALESFDAMTLYPLQMSRRI